MVSYSFGQNQMVSGGISTGVVQRVEGVFPEKCHDSLLVWPSRHADRGATSGYTLHTPARSVWLQRIRFHVNIVTSRSNRVGVDAVKLIKTIMLQNKSSSKSSANPQ
jgi:hypothetical protein